MNVETLPGADSVHHTCGICYQDILPTIQIPQKITETKKYIGIEGTL